MHPKEQSSLTWKVVRASALILPFFWAANIALAESFKTTLSLDEIQSQALVYNKDLIAAHYLIKEAEGRLEQAGLWSNPELELYRTDDGAFENAGEYAGSAGFHQKFPISGRLGQAKKLARVDVALAVAEVRNEERLLLAQVLTVARKFQVTQHRLKLNADSMAGLRKLIAISEKRLKQAEISPADVNIERLELSKLETRSLALKIAIERSRIALNTLMARPPQTALIIKNSGIPAEPELSSSETVEQHIARRPDRHMAALQIDRAEAEARLAKAESFEDWTVGVGYDRDKSKYDSEFVKDDTAEFIGMRLIIPLPLWNQNQGNISAAKARRLRAEAHLMALDQKIAEEIESARTAVLNLKPSLKQFEVGTLKLAEHNLELLNKSYGQGLVPISAVIQAQQQLIDVRESYSNTLWEFWSAETELQKATASNPFLNRRGLDDK